MLDYISVKCVEIEALTLDANMDVLLRLLYLTSVFVGLREGVCGMSVVAQIFSSIKLMSGDKEMVVIAVVVDV